jgi:hypothetical protein
MASSAAADPVAAVVTTPPAAERVTAPEPAPHTAASVVGAPVPGDESGRTDDRPGDGVGRQAARALLAVPRVLFEVVDAPVRGVLWVNTRYHPQDLYYQVFFNDARTIGLYPTAAFDTGFGYSVGAAFVDRDLFGAREHLALAASTGGEYRVAASVSARTGKRLGDALELAAVATFTRSPKAPFYGIGNADLGPAPSAPVDPRVDTTAVETHYRQQVARAALTADLHADRLHMRTTGSLTALQIGVITDEPAIDQVYDRAGLVGLGGVHQAYGEVEVRWDSRRRGSKWDSPEAYSAGQLAAAFVGRVQRLNTGADFSRYGLELQHFLRLAEGPRVLVARLHGEAVTGRLDEVPLTELPSLGGATFLRGYPSDRFRDRVAVLGSIAYQWDLAMYADASLFVDAGRVFPSIRDLSLDQPRVGYGLAIAVHSESSFLFEGSLASSIDGGVFLNLTFNRALDAHRRWR